MLMRVVVVHAQRWLARGILRLMALETLPQTGRGVRDEGVIRGFKSMQPNRRSEKRSTIEAFSPTKHFKAGGALRKLFPSYARFIGT